MCNDYRLILDIASIVSDLEDLDIKVALPEGMPNVPARDDIKITDVAPIIRGADGADGKAELVNRRWSWPGANGRPVHNFRTEGRDFSSHRCLIITDGFYEFTDPEDPKQKRLDKWLFTMNDHSWFCIAGIWREHGDAEAFTMLTMDAGEEIAPYHHRQIIPLARDQWRDWLNPNVPAGAVLRHLPKGSFSVTRVYPPSQAAIQDSLLL